MGNSWPGAREGPAQRPAQGEDELSAALGILRTERGSQWTKEMEGLVEYHLRTNWPGPCTKETQHQWTARLCTTYDQNEPAMRTWLRQRLPAAETQWKEEGGHTKDYGKGPPRSAGGEKPEPDQAQPQDPHGEQWAWDQGWSRGGWSSGRGGEAWDAGRAEHRRDDSGSGYRTWGARQAPADPWHEGHGQGVRGQEAKGAPADPWGAYAGHKQRQQPQEQQPAEGGCRPQQDPDQRGAPADPGQSQPRRAPWWEAEWLVGRSHQDMRYGDWRCGALPCRYANFARRLQCKVCQAPKSQAKWELPLDPRTRTCRCGTKIFPDYRGACRVCYAPIAPLDGEPRLYNPLGDASLPDHPPIASDLSGHSAEPIMLWTEAMLHPTGPPKVSGGWPAAPELWHQTVEEPSGELLKVPYVTSDVVAAIWQVDHAARQALRKVPGAPQTYLEGRRSPPTLLPLEVWRIADQPARDRPHSNLVGPSHLLRRPQN